jgi:hypothetical protein
MRKIFIYLVSAFFFTVPFLFSTNLKAHDTSTPTTTIIGQVTMVDQTMLRIKEDSTGAEYNLNASPDKLREVRTGYRAEIKTDHGKILSLTLLGMPMRAESQPFQKWTVIKYPQ